MLDLRYAIVAVGLLAIGCHTNTGIKHHHQKTSQCNEDTLTPYFYIVKLWFTRVYTFFLFLL